MQKPGLVSKFKNLIVPKGRRPRTILFGPLRGTRMLLDLSRQSQYYLGTAEAEMTPWLVRLSRDIATFVDIGAAEGIITLFALTKTPAKRVLSFEPGAALREMLNENVALNDVPPEVDFQLSSMLVGDHDGEDVTRLDAWSDYLKEPCLIKVDVEGAEGRVLAGATEILQSADVRWIIETHSADLEDECKTALRDAGLKTTTVTSAGWRFVLPESRPSAHLSWLVAYRE